MDRVGVGPSRGDLSMNPPCTHLLESLPLLTKLPNISSSPPKEPGVIIMPMTTTPAYVDTACLASPRWCAQSFYALVLFHALYSLMS